ncbi:MAG TPA: hypothetical protein VMR54_01205 [Thermoanaerobaculia bacterium]|nr:hypothetical protein [Thermoanaerobaculia bacterium]
MPKFLPAALIAGALAIACVDESNFYTLDGPTEVRYFIVFDANAQPVWKLSAEGAVKIDRIRYGQVPTGFIQEQPALGKPPRALQAGEKLAVVIITEAAAYRHEGQATGSASFRGGYGETSPLRGDKLERALRGQPITDPA